MRLQTAYQHIGCNHLFDTGIELLVVFFTIAGQMLTKNNQTAATAV